MHKMFMLYAITGSVHVMFCFVTESVQIVCLVCLLDLILYVPVNNFFSYVGTGLPLLSQH